MRLIGSLSSLFILICCRCTEMVGMGESTVLMPAIAVREGSKMPVSAILELSASVLGCISTATSLSFGTAAGRDCHEIVGCKAYRQIMVYFKAALGVWIIGKMFQGLIGCYSLNENGILRSAMLVIATILLMSVGVVSESLFHIPSPQAFAFIWISMSALEAADIYHIFKEACRN